SAPRCGALAVALRDQPSSGATRTLPPFGALSCADETSVYLAQHWTFCAFNSRRLSRLGSTLQADAVSCEPVQCPSPHLAGCRRVSGGAQAEVRHWASQVRPWETVCREHAVLVIPTAARRRPAADAQRSVMGHHAGGQPGAAGAQAAAPDPQQ